MLDAAVTPRVSSRSARTGVQMSSALPPSPAMGGPGEAADAEPIRRNREALDYRNNQWGVDQRGELAADGFGRHRLKCSVAEQFQQLGERSGPRGGYLTLGDDRSRRAAGRDDREDAGDERGGHDSFETSVDGRVVAEAGGAATTSATRAGSW